DIDYSRAHCEIWDTQWRGAGIPPVISLDENGEPTFLHVLSENDLQTHRYYYVRRVDGQWRQTPITHSSHQWNSCHLARDRNNTLHAYVITGEGYLKGGYMDRHGGGRLEEWISRDRGDSWKKLRDLTPGPDWRCNNIQPVVRADGSLVDDMLLFYGWQDRDAPAASAFLIDRTPPGSG
ncbi:MAG: hypothetical protein VB858_03610, partial [Planctomycetaceae bacterium]